MRKALGFIVIAFALVAGTATFMSVSPHQAFACEDGDKRGS
ncbi:MAG TPA: hypothetical protein VEC94_10770 [Pseudolabrys sp.]|nr:hypothetical protein [Pseudolabrys sp.]